MATEISQPPKRYRGTVVVVDDEEGMCTILSKVLGQEGYHVTAFTRPKEAIAYIQNTPPEVVVTDMKMPDATGMDVLQAAREANPSTSVVVMTAYGTIEGATAAMRAGAYDYITKPFHLDDLLLTVNKALERTRLEEENEALAQTLSRQYAPQAIVGESAVMREVHALIAKVAPTDAPVLIEGESGTGKELVARAIHQHSGRHNKRFVAINCASIPEQLLESELFGHEKGAFTGAERTKMGLFEVAHKGTLFLDEIAELPLALQAKLLRAIQEHEIQRVGGLHTISVDVRLIAATNRNLLSAVEERSFRSDLYYRLNVISICLPPLRERREDIPLLVDYFMARAAQRLRRPVPILSPEALAVLERYPYPGNVRELENIIERLMVLCDKPIIEPEDLPLEVRSLHSAATASPPAYPLDYRRAREEFERSYLEQLLRHTRGNVTEASRLSGISRRHLYEKFERLGIRADRFLHS